MGIFSLMWWKNFAKELVVIVWPGTRGIVKVVPIIVGGIGGVAGWFRREKTLIKVEEYSMEINTVLLITIIIGAVWCIVGVGYAVARTHSAKILLGDTLYLDDGNTSLRTEVSVRGYGDVEPLVEVVNIFDEHGNQVEPTSIRHQKLQWAFRAVDDQKMVLNEKGKCAADISVFWSFNIPNFGWQFCVYTSDGHRLIDRKRIEGLKIRARLRATATNCSKVEKDYWIESAPNRTGYRPCSAPALSTTSVVADNLPTPTPKWLELVKTKFLKLVDAFYSKKWSCF